MYKYINLVFILVFMFIGCEKDNPSEPNATVAHDQALVGTWDLTESKLNGNLVSSENFSDCLVKIEFGTSGSGLVWEEDYGVACGCKSFSWSTTKDQLTIHEENEYPFVSTYVVSDGTCSISFVDEGNVELVYTKQ